MGHLLRVDGALRMQGTRGRGFWHKAPRRVNGAPGHRPA